MNESLLSELTAIVSPAGMHGENDGPVTVAPASDEQWTRVMHAVRQAGATCRVAGNGSWAPRGAHADANAPITLSTARTTGILAYEPGDGTLTARAGTLMAEIASVARNGGHHVTPDVARPTRATLGGVIGAGRSGFERLRYGPLRHNLLGIRVLLADGSIAQSGGRLVKNVTGYDLHRLYAGSRGTLCVVLDASLRLYPDPETRLCLRIPFETRPAALAAARSVLDDPVRPVAVLVRDAELLVFLAGRREVLDWEVQAVQAHATRPAQLLDSAAEQELRESLRDFPPAGLPWARISARRSRIGAALEAFEHAVKQHGLVPDTIVEPGIATALVRFETSDEDTLIALQNSLGHLSAQVRWYNTSSPHPAPQPDPAAALMDNLKRALDPTGLFPATRPDVAG